MFQGQGEIAAPGTEINDDRPGPCLAECSHRLFPELFSLRPGNQSSAVGAHLDGAELDRPFEMLQGNSGESLPDQVQVSLRRFCI